MTTPTTTDTTTTATTAATAPVTDLFATATREKYRYPSVVGLLTTEQLWELPLTTERANTASLDNVAGTIAEQLDKLSGRSFVPSAKPNAAHAQLTNQLEILKAVIAVRVQERDAAAKRADNAARRKKILEVLAEKENEALVGKTREELLAEFEALS